MDENQLVFLVNEIYENWKIKLVEMKIFHLSL